METTNKTNGFRNTAIVAGVVLYGLKLIAKMVYSQISDPQQVSYYYIYIMVIYWIMAICLLSLFLRVKEAIKANQVYGYICLVFLGIFAIQLYQTYQITPAAIEYSSWFSGDGIKLLSDELNAAWIVGDKGAEVLSNINLWGIFAIGQFVVYLFGDSFLMEGTASNTVEQKIKVVPKSSYFICVNDMEIEIKINNEISFGNGGESNVYLESEYVSSCHGVIGKDDKCIYVRDLDSTNKTFINGKEISPMENYELKSGDIVTFANVDVSIVER